MRAHEILVETKDENGLIRNNRNNDYSIYKNVTAIAPDFESGRRDPWIAYVSVENNPDLLELVEEHGWIRIGLGHKTFLSIARFEDERDAAYVGQTIAEDLEENIMKMLAGEDWESVVGQIPSWMGSPPARDHSERKTLPEVIPPTPRIFDVEKATIVLVKLEGGRDRKASMKYQVNTDRLTGTYNLPDLLKIMKFFVIDRAMNYNDAAKTAALAFIELKKKKKLTSK